MSGSAHVTNGGNDGMLPTVGLELLYLLVSQAKFRDETSRREKQCNICETLICKLVYLFIVFGEYDRYIGNINHLWR